MKKGKRFLLVGADSFSNNAFGSNQESFDSVQDLINYTKYMNYRPEYLGVFDKTKGEELEIAELIEA